jgi:hypothetical protein
MKTTHIALAKHLDGRPVLESDLKVGLEIHYPSGMGGVFKYRCKSIDDKSAVFINQHKDWPGTLVMEFAQPDFTLEDFQKLAEALKAINSFGCVITNEQSLMIHRAHILGYAYQRSYTQAGWTENGVEQFRVLKGKGA